MKKFKYIIYTLSLAIFFAGCAGEEELPFVEFDGLGYGAYPRLIDGVNGDFDYEDPSNSAIDFTVEFYDEAQGQNVESYAWTASYGDFGPASIGMASKSSFGTSPDGYPSASFTFNFQEVMDALSMEIDDIAGGAPFTINGTVTKTDGSTFTTTNTSGSIQGGASWQGFFVHNVNIANLPCTSDLGGIFDCTSTATNQDAGIGWDDCDGSSWTGTVIWEAQHDPTSFDLGVYRMYSIKAEGGEQWDDASMGAYYSCYDSAAEGSLPNGADGATGSVVMQESCSKLSWTGSSQWGEVYSITGVTADGLNLTIEWTNDYGEGARTVLTRTDGQTWPEDMSF